MLFPEGIFYDKKKDRVRTSSVNSVFSYFVELARVLKEKKSGKNNLKIASPAFVEASGSFSNLKVEDLSLIEDFMDKTPHK